MNIFSRGFKIITKNAPQRTPQASPVLRQVTQEEAMLNINSGLKFLVSRLESGRLPVYKQFKNGKTRVVTIVKVKGNRRQFVDLISKVIPQDRIECLLGKIRINGNYKDVLSQWLLLHNF
jgi:hypothetical protein